MHGCTQRSMVGVALLSICFLTACTGGGSSSTSTRSSHAGAKPIWVMNPQKSDRFLYGVGSAPSTERASAKEEARRDLLSQIRVSLRSARTQNTLSRTSRQQKNGEAVSMLAHLDTAVDDMIQTTVALTDLPGIQVDEERDVKGVTYVLCSMDRGAWAASVRSKVAAVDTKILSAYNTVTDHMSEDLSALQQVTRVYKELMPLFSRREMLEERYSLASLNGTLPAPPINPVEIRATLATALSQITVALPQDASVQALLPSIVESCAERGLQVINDRSKASLYLDFTVTETSRQIGEGVMKLRGIAKGTVIERASGRHLGGLTVSASGSSSDLQEARRRMTNSLSQKIASALTEQLFTYLTRL